MVDPVEHGLQHADDSAVRSVLAFGEPAKPVEMTEQLVGAVDEVHNHFGLTLDLVATLAKSGHQTFR
jgi:hypothetical protein